MWRCCEESEKSGPRDSVACYNARQAQQLRECTRFCDVEVDATDDASINTVKGVVGGIGLDITEPELLEELTDQVKCVKRIHRRVNGKLEPTHSFLLTFGTNKLPEMIYVDYEKRKIHEYRPKVTRCYHCQKFGHSAIHCNGKARLFPVWGKSQVGCMPQ